MHQIEFDLHVHTTASDGVLTSAQVISMAKRKGLKGLAITDHDTVAGIASAIKAGVAKDIEVIPGVELSTEWDRREVHILGYFLDYRALGVTEFLDKLRYSRERRAWKIIKRLDDLGISVSMARVLEIAGSGSVGRPHIARALVERGYMASIKEAFDKLLGSGCPAYVPREKLSPEEAIQFILHYRGVPVLAHPCYIGSFELIEHLVQKGLKGIEVFYPDHDHSAIDQYLALARSFGLIATGGSDFHGADHGSTDLGETGVPSRVVSDLKKSKRNCV